MPKYETQYIRDEREVPHGYIALVDFDSQSLDHKRLSSAHARGLIRAVKMMRSPKDHRCGKVWVHHRDATEFLASYDSAKSEAKTQANSEPPRDAARNEAGVIALCEINNALALMLPVLERIATAVENIATQPHPAEHATRQDIMATIGGNGTWRDMNGESH